MASVRLGPTDDGVRLQGQPLFPGRKHPPPLIQTPEGGTRLTPCDSEFTCTREKRVTVTPCRRPERLCKDLTALNTAKGTAGRGRGNRGAVCQDGVGKQECISCCCAMGN